VTEREVEAEPKGHLAYEAASWLQSIAGFAGGTVDLLEQGWQRPVRHNKGIELHALQSVLILDIASEHALKQKEAAPLLSRDTDVLTAYRWEAALLTVGRVMPFDKSERIGFLFGQRHMEDPRGFGARVTEQYPELVDRWHRWLWLNLDGEPVRTREALGASAVLAMACSDLNVIAYDALAAHDPAYQRAALAAHAAASY
jgi:hypothetical protein